MADEKPVIVIKKKGGHGGHHGGAWKVAFADFMTAMMAFFLVMWLVGTADAPSKKAIAAYFQRPGIFQTGSGTPLLIGQSGILNDGFTPQKKSQKTKFAMGEKKTPQTTKHGTENIEKEKEAPKSGNMVANVEEKPEDEPETIDEKMKEYSKNSSQTGSPSEPTAQELAKKLAEEIKREMQASPELMQLLGEVEVRVDADGLNIEIMDTEHASMFALGSAKIDPSADAAFEKIASILRKTPNTIDIIGHTDAKPFSPNFKNYTNWELSSDRANAARRLLERHGIGPEKVTSVLGRADRELKNKDKPQAASNRRITLKLRFPEALVPETLKVPSRVEDIVPPTPPTGSINQHQQDPGETISSKNTSDTVQGASSSEPVHSFTVKEILEAQREKRKQTIPLPPAARPTNDPIYIQKDKIFSDNPVFGPPNL